MKLILLFSLWLPSAIQVDDPPAIDRAFVASLAEDFVPEQKFEVWLAGSLSMQGRVAVQFVEKGGEELLLIEHTAEGRVIALGEESTVSTVMRSWYSLTGMGALHSGELIEVEDGARRHSRVERTATGYRRTLEVLGEAGSEELDSLEDTLAEALRLTRWLREPREVGDTLSLQLTDWTQLDEPGHESYVYLGPATFEHQGKEISGHRLRSISDGMVFEGTHWPNGEMFSATGAGGIVEIRTVEEFSSFADAELKDMATTFMLTVDLPLGDAELLEELVIEAPPSARGIFSDGSRQSVIESERGVTVTITADAQQRDISPLSAEERLKWLKPTPEYALELVRETANEIVGGAKDPELQARLLANWVESTLEYTAAQNAVSALEVLENESGDCTEYSLLFVALARSIGLPAREVGGYVWAEDEEFGSGFFGHAWAEIHDGAGWWSVDPTWGQYGVDAGHLVVDPAKEARVLELMGAGGFAFSLVRLSRSEEDDEEFEDE